MKPPASPFPPTQWTQVLAARGNSTLAGGVLRDLCAAYYEPVNAFLRRGGQGEDEARELAHGFFEWVLSRDPFAAADRQRGRFRNYLLGALKHFLTHERGRRAALKRGGGAVHLPLAEGTATSPGSEVPDDGALPPDREFDRQWALHVLRCALGELEQEAVRCGGHARFVRLKPCLTGEASHGELAALAATEGWPEATARSHLHRLRRQFRAAVRRQITPTLSSGGETADELATLMAALSGS